MKQHVVADKSEELEMTNPEKSNDDHLGYFSVSEQSEDNFESQKPFVQLELFINISSCFPFYLEFTIPRFFLLRRIQECDWCKKKNEWTDVAQSNWADLRLSTKCWIHV